MTTARQMYRRTHGDARLLTVRRQTCQQQVLPVVAFIVIGIHIVEGFGQVELVESVEGVIALPSHVERRWLQRGLTDGAYLSVQWLTVGIEG